MRLEKDLIAKAKEYVESIGGIFVKMNATPFFTKGFPDTVVILRGKAWFIEFKKSENDVLTKIQFWWIERIRRAGGMAFGCWNLKSFKEIIK